MNKSGSPGKPVPALRQMPWGLVGLLMVYSFVSWLNRVSMSAAGTERIIPHGVLSETQMGDIYSALVLTYTVFMLPGGWVTDRAGPRLALILMGLGSAVFAAMTGMVGQFLVPATGLYGGLLAARGLMGVFTAPVYPASALVVSLVVPENRRAEANGMIMGAALLGIAAAPFAFGFLMDWLHWPVAFVVMGHHYGLGDRLDGRHPPPIVAKTPPTGNLPRRRPHRSPGGTCCAIEGFYS